MEIILNMEVMKKEIKRYQLKNILIVKDSDKECVMHSKSDNLEIMIHDKADEVMEEVFQPLLSRYQIGFWNINER